MLILLFLNPSFSTTIIFPIYIHIPFYILVIYCSDN